MSRFSSAADQRRKSAIATAARGPDREARLSAGASAPRRAARRRSAPPALRVGCARASRACPSAARLRPARSRPLSEPHQDISARREAFPSAQLLDPLESICRRATHGNRQAFASAVLCVSSASAPRLRRVGATFMRVTDGEFSQFQDHPRGIGAAFTGLPAGQRAAISPAIAASNKSTTRALSATPSIDRKSAREFRPIAASSVPGAPRVVTGEHRSTSPYEQCSTRGTRRTRGTAPVEASNRCRAPA